MNTTHEWVWLGDHLAVDFANTTRGIEPDVVDLIGSIAEVDEWIRHEPAQLPQVEITEDDVVKLRALRDATKRVLLSAIRDERFGAADIGLINSHIEDGRVFRLLDCRPKLSRLVTGEGFEAFAGVLAAAVVDLIARDDLAAIAICEAPGCGQIFHRSRVDQKWCSAGCGNRARVDRHRHRNPRAQRETKHQSP